MITFNRKIYNYARVNVLDVKQPYTTVKSKLTAKNCDVVLVLDTNNAFEQLNCKVKLLVQ